MENIALTITLNGVEKTVTSVQELEKAIFEAREQLQKFSGTQAEFQKLNAEVNRLDRALNRIKQNKTQELISAFARIGSVVTTSFATAQAALNLFGVENENVTKAAAQAQNLLTISLGARQIATELLDITQAKLNIETWAGVRATNASNIITKTFFNTLKANPIGVVVTIFTTLVGLLLAYTSDTEKATSATENFNKILADQNKTREFQIELLRAQGATEDEISNARISTAKRDLANARTQLEVLKRSGASQVQINQQLNIIAESKKVLLLENEKIEERASDKAKEDAENRKKAEEARIQRLIEEQRILGEIRKIELDRITQGFDVEFPERELALQKRVEQLRALSKTQDEYNDIIEKFNRIQRTGISPLDVGEATNPGEKLANQLKVISGLVKSSIELAGLSVDTETSKLRDLLKTQKQFIEGTATNYEGYVANQKALLEFERNFVNSFVETNLKGFEGTTEQIQVQREILTGQANVVFQNLVENAQQLIGVQDAYKKSLENLKKLGDENERLAKSTEVLNGFLQENRELLTQSFTLPISSIDAAKSAILTLEKEIRTQRFDESRIFLQDVTNLEKLLGENRIDITKASYEEKLQLLLSFLKKEVSATEDAETKKQEATQKTLDKIQTAIQAFQTSIQAIQQSVSDFYNFQFDQLEKRNKRLQETILGDSEEANAKRLEAERIYNAERTRLEKQQTKTSLQLSRLQALANVAEAITKAFTAGPILGQIAAGIVAAASAVQVGIISQQISAVDSYRRGGLLRRQGGGFLVNGPAHEYGGVKYQGGGIELEGNEAVINRQSAVRFGNLLNQINMAGGGNALVSNFDDSRIVEAIAKQRMEPIRAYVVESDITRKQEITRRLELLSQL
jgi:regulator of sigma D